MVVENKLTYNDQDTNHEDPYSTIHFNSHKHIQLKKDILQDVVAKLTKNIVTIFGSAAEG